METTPHVVFDISNHGFGHAAMSLPVVEALARGCPDLRLTLRTGFNEDWLRARTSASFEHVHQPDFGMAMIDGLRVDAERSLAYYTELHRRWAYEMAVAADQIRRLKPDLVVSNVAYLSLAAAKRARVNCVAYSSLNWADVFWAYCRELPGAESVRQHMADAYAEASLFLQPAPAMPMPSIHNGWKTGTVARVGQDRRAEIVSRLGLEPRARLILLSMGGIATPIDFGVWPRLQGWTVITGDDEASAHPDVVPWSMLSMPFIDCVASIDLLIIKPGYGLITEGACNRKPMLCLPRSAWPETEAELAWADQNGVAELLSETALRSGDFLVAADRLAGTDIPQPPSANGAEEIATLLLARIGVG